MAHADIIEDYLISLEVAFARVEDGLWVVHDPDGPLEGLQIYVTSGLVNLRHKLFELPSNPPIGLLRRLLELNASDMVHCAYAIERDDVVIEGAYEVENLDRNELQAMLDSVALAVSTHHAELSRLRVASL